SGRADQRKRGLWTGAGHLKGRGTAGFGQRPAREEGTAPGGLRGADRTPDHPRRQTSHRATAGVDEPGLTGQSLTVLDDAHDVAAATTQPPRGQHEYLADGAIALDEL